MLRLASRAARAAAGGAAPRERLPRSAAPPWDPLAALGAWLRLQGAGVKTQSNEARACVLRAYILEP